MDEIATNVFDYSLLDAKTKEFLEERANIIYGIQSKSAYEIGKQLAKAQKELSTRGYGCFEEWYRSGSQQQKHTNISITSNSFLRKTKKQKEIIALEKKSD